MAPLIFIIVLSVLDVMRINIIIIIAYLFNQIDHDDAIELSLREVQ